METPSAGAEILLPSTVTVLSTSNGVEVYSTLGVSRKTSILTFPAFPASPRDGLGAVTRLTFASLFIADKDSGLTFTKVTAGSSRVVCVSSSIDFPIGEFLTSETVSFRPKSHLARRP